MKTKKIYIILLLCAFMAHTAFADMQQNTQNWLQTPSEPLKTRGGAIGSEETPSADPTVPVGDPAWMLILGMGLTYGVYVYSGKRERK